MTNLDVASLRLAVPDAAVDALHVRTGLERRDARMIAAPVVAAELRAQAAAIQATVLVEATDAEDGPRYARAIACDLRARADELDPPRDIKAMDYRR